jgi:hypothetical protein
MCVCERAVSRLTSLFESQVEVDKPAEAAALA